MAVSLPTAADVRKAREQAAKSAAERAEAGPHPAAGRARRRRARRRHGVTRPSTDARARAAEARGRAGEQAEQVQHRLAELPQRMSGEELRKLLDELRAQVEKVYAEFAERGEQTWDQLRSQAAAAAGRGHAQGLHREARRARRHAGRRGPRRR